MKRSSTMVMSVLLLGSLLALTCTFVTPPFVWADPLDTWHPLKLPTTSPLYQVAWGGGSFVAVGKAGTIITSSNGTSWTLAKSNTSVWLYGVTYGNGTFVVAGSDTIAVSPDGGNTWYTDASGTGEQLYSVAFGKETFVIVGQSGVALVSTDYGRSWRQASTGVSTGLFGVAYGNGTFVAVGAEGIILTSPDGANWTRRQADASDWWFDQIAFGDGLFVALSGNEGATEQISLVSASSGATWEHDGLGTNNDFYCIAFGSGVFVAVGARGIILTSGNGTDWTSRAQGMTEADLRGVAMGNNTFVVTGFAVSSGISTAVAFQSDPVIDLPVARAGQDVVVAVGTKAGLDGSDSYDPGGSAISYQWEIASAPSASRAVLVNPSSSQPSFVPDVAGTYTFTLVVTTYPGNIASNPDEVKVTTGVPPVAKLGTASLDIAKTGAQVVLDGSGSYAPDGNVPISYDWVIASRPSNSTSQDVLKDAKSAQAVFVPDARGVYLVGLTVINSLGLTSSEETIRITVGSPPVAEAGPDQIVDVGKEVPLDGRSSFSPDSAALTYEWTFSSRPEVSQAILSDSTSDRPTFKADRAGTYVIQLQVRDSAGFESQGDTVTVVSKVPDSGSSGGGGCFIATAAFGSSLAPEVTALRGFRDTCLLTNRLGKIFVSVYYRLSPPMAELIRRHGFLKSVSRTFLRPIVYGVVHPIVFFSLIAFSAVLGVALLFVGGRSRRWLP